MQNSFDAKQFRCKTVSMQNSFDAKQFRCKTVSMQNSFDVLQFWCKLVLVYSKSISMKNSFDVNQFRCISVDLLWHLRMDGPGEIDWISWRFKSRVMSCFRPCHFQAKKKIKLIFKTSVIHSNVPNNLTVVIKRVNLIKVI